MSTGLVNRTTKIDRVIPSSITAMFLLALIMVGCSGGSTDGGAGAAAASANGTQFTGSSCNLAVSLSDDTIAVGEITGFTVTLTNNSGQPITDSRISFATEEGAAITEPTSCRESTDSSGRVSGSVGCSTSGGSFQVKVNSDACAKSKSVRLKCTGNTPDGLDFPNPLQCATLGGGTSNNPNGSGTGGTINDVSVTAVSIFDKADGVLTVDNVACTNSSCGGCDGSNTTTNDAEPFFVNTATLSIENDSNQDITITGYSFSVPSFGSGFSSGTFGAGGNIVVRANGGSAQSGTIVFTAFSGINKIFRAANNGTSSAVIGDASYDVTFTVFFENGNGDTGSASITQAINFTNIDNC